MFDFLFSPDVIPYVFAILTILAIIIYTIFDGYDLGVGCLSVFIKDKSEKNKAINSIAPFWDANETWLVLFVGLLMTIFPIANGIIFQNLYIVITGIIFMLILRGVSFEFRMKMLHHERLWTLLFGISSTLASFFIGFFITNYTLGLLTDVNTKLISIIGGVFFVFVHIFIATGWLNMKLEGVIQHDMIYISKRVSIFLFVILYLIGGLCYKNYFFSHKNLYFITFFFIIAQFILISYCLIVSFLKEKLIDKLQFLPFVIQSLFILSIFCIVGSIFYSDIIPGMLSIKEASSEYHSLVIILNGALFFVPFILFCKLILFGSFLGKEREKDIYY